MVWRDSKCWASTLAVLVVWSLLSFGACTSPTPESGEGAAVGTDEPEGSALLPPEPASPEELPGVLAAHLESMALVARPLREYCDMQGADLNAYFDLVESEFDAGASASFSDDEHATLKAAYDKLAIASGRCLSTEAGRRFSQRLIAKVRPLTAP